MRNFLLLALFLVARLLGLAQSKPVIDTFAINHWYGISSEVAISDNGHWVMYNINNMPYQSNTLVIQESYGRKKLEFIGAQPGFFTSDDKRFVFMMRDSLRLLALKTGQINVIPGVMEITRLGESSSTDWIAYRLVMNPGQLVIHNLVSGVKFIAANVKDFVFASGHMSVLLHESDSVRQSLNLMPLSTGKEKQVWTSLLAESLSLDGYLFDKQGAQVAFVLSNPTGERNIWLYSSGMQHAEQKLNFHPKGISVEYKLAADLPSFSGDGHYLYFKIQEPDLPKPKPNFVSLDIWSWTDTILMSTQLHHLTPERFDCVIGTLQNTLPLKLTDRWEKVESVPDTGNYVVVAYNPSGDRFWLKDNVKNYLVSLKDGSRTLLKPSNRTEFHFSPNGKYLVYYDSKDESKYSSINLATGKYIPVSRDIHVDISEKNEYDIDTCTVANYGRFSKWLNDTSFLLYDHFDPWVIDVTGRLQAKNLTDSFGRLNNIKFKIIDSHGLMIAYNMDNRFNGFYRLNLLSNGQPKLLSMDSCTYYHDADFEEWAHSFNMGMVPIKAKKTKVYLVKKQSSVLAPCLYVTTDFKKMILFAKKDPTSNYNWLKSKLFSFRQGLDRNAKGVLFVPENFDLNQKYPVIITYYRQMAQRIYEFPTPELMTNDINIPWFVSRGYVVACIDIYIINHEVGSSALNAVNGVYNYLSKLNYVDSSKIGIMGHSFGGYETNYIVSHTDKFAAAVESAGTSDYISSSLQLNGPEEGSRLMQYENQLNALLWHEPLKYLNNSPIMAIEKVNTPLLIIHSKNDSAVPWEQAVELFVSLRRLNKKAWILQYDNGNHGVYDPADMWDYTQRVMQFFDSYLKGSAIPDWMQKGKPAKTKGVN